jgi:hypothetical protein
VFALFYLEGLFQASVYELTQWKIAPRPFEKQAFKIFDSRFPLL